MGRPARPWTLNRRGHSAHSFLNVRPRPSRFVIIYGTAGRTYDMKMESVLLAFWFSVTGLRLASLLTRRRSLAYAVGTLVVFVLPCLAVSLFIERPLSGLFVWLILPAGIYLVGKFLYGFSDMERKLAEMAERGPLG